VRTLFIEPGSPWENGYIKRFNGKLRDELLNGEVFYTLKEAKVLIAKWRHDYNWIRLHMGLGYKAPAPATIAATDAASAPLRPPQRQIREDQVRENMVRYSL